AGWVGTWWSYLLAFLGVGPGARQVHILRHDGGHRLVFSGRERHDLCGRRLNDLCGRWLLGYPAVQGMLSYRRAHMAHHRDEMGPDEPDAGLYAGYPISPDSLPRQLTRDLLLVPGTKNLRALLVVAFRRTAGGREAREVVAVQLALFAAACAW